MAFAFTNTLQFPADLNAPAPIMNLGIVQYLKENITTQGKGNRVSTISLPMPDNFTAAYSANWSTQGLGAGADAADAIISDVKGKMGTSAGSLADALKAQLTNGNAVKFAEQKILDVAFGAADTFAPGATNILLQGLGVSRNPFNAVLYEGPDFRGYHFRWKFYPRNAQESQTLLAIVRSIKAAQAASYNAATNLLFDYPMVLYVSTSVEDQTFKIAPCSIAGFEYNPQPDGRPNYHKDNYPNGVELNLTLKELAIILRDDIDQGF